MSRPLNSRDYAALSYDVYTNRVADPKSKIDIEGRDYYVLATASDLNGYQGTVYLDIESNTVVVAHRGSERDTALKFAQDWGFTNAQMVLRRTNPQVDSADALTRQGLEVAGKHIGPDGQPAQVTTTGHSMGGTHAQIMAHRYGLYGETFNAFGANSLGLGVPADANARVINHVRASDIVSAASLHYGQVRGYALRKDVQDLLADGQDPRTQGVVGLGRDIAKVGFAPHDIQQFYRQNPISGAPLLSQENAERFDQNRAMLETFRHDIYQVRAMLGNSMDLRREFNQLLDRRGIPDDPKRWPKPPQEWDAGFPDVFKREAQNRHEQARGALDKTLDGIRSVPDRVLEWGGEKMRQLDNNVRQQLGVPLSANDGLPAQRVPLHDPVHRDHAMFSHAVAGMMAIDQAHQRTPDHRTYQAAAALTAEAVASGMRRIDDVVLSTDGSRLIAIENGSLDVHRRMASLPTVEALGQATEHSQARLEQAHHAQAQQQSHQQEQQFQQQRAIRMG